MADSPLILNVNPGAELDVIHRRAGLTEQCNTDAIEPGQRLNVDLITGRAMVNRGQARYCEHCAVQPEPAT